MNGKEQQSFIACRPEQCHSQQRPAFEDERSSSLLDSQLKDWNACRTLRDLAQIHSLKFKAQGRSDYLHRLAVDDLECCTERIMPIDNLGNALLQCRNIDLPLEAEREIVIVSRIVRFQLVYEPETFLGE